MSTGPKKIENRGGARVGAGRKRVHEFSDHERSSLLREAKKRAKDEKKSIPSVLLDILYDNKDANMQLRAIKVYYEITVTKASEIDVTKTKAPESPVILPERKPDPAKVVSLR